MKVLRLLALSLFKGFIGRSINPVCGQSAHFEADLERAVPTDFTVERVRSVALHKLNAVELNHGKTGARVLLLVPWEDGLDRGFAINFRTPAVDDTGVTHIIEHSVLSGSEKYPVHSLIDHFWKSSMATFVNALTYPDRTTYPVASVNGRDLLNLAEVYLDSVFQPLMLSDPMNTFMREGWHLSVANTRSSSTAEGSAAAEESIANGTYAGVVYSEMKGVFSDPKTRLYYRAMRELFENTTYRHVSGGDPKAIPDLTYDDLLNYYYKYYHPANAQFYYFGSLEVVKPLLEMVSRYSVLAKSRNDARSRSTLSDNHHDDGSDDESDDESDGEDDLDGARTTKGQSFGRSAKIAEINPFLWNETTIIDVPVQSSEGTPTGGLHFWKTLGSTSSPLCTPLTQDLVKSTRAQGCAKVGPEERLCDRLALNVLSHLLVGKRTSPLREKLEESKIGTDVENYGVFDHGLALAFGIGVSGVPLSNVTVSTANLDVTTTESPEETASEETATLEAANVEASIPQEQPTTAAAKPSVVARVSDAVTEKFMVEVLEKELERLAAVGFDKAAVEGALNSYEFSIREATGNTANRAIGFLDSVFDEWNYERDPIGDLHIDQGLKCLRSRVEAEPNYFAGLIPSTLLRPSNSVLLRSHPVRDLHEREGRQMQEEVDAKLAQMDATGLAALLEQTETLAVLKVKKDSAEALASLPTLPLDVVTRKGHLEKKNVDPLHSALGRSPKAEPADLEKEKVKEKEKEKEDDGEVSGEERDDGGIVVSMDLATAGVAYINLHLDVCDWDLEGLKIAPIFNYLLRNGNIANRTSAEITNALESLTGGLRSSLNLETIRTPGRVDDPSKGAAFLRISFKCLTIDDSKLQSCVDLVWEIVEGQIGSWNLPPSDAEEGGVSTRSNRELVIDWLKEHIQKEETGVLGSPAEYASEKFSSYFSLVDSLSYELSGLPAVSLLRSLLKEIDIETETDEASPHQASAGGHEGWRRMGERLDRMWRAVKTPSRLAISLAAEKDALPKIKKLLAAKVHTHWSKPPPENDIDYTTEALSEEEEVGERERASFGRHGFEYQTPLWLSQFRKLREGTLEERFWGDVSTSPDVALVIDSPLLVNYNYLGARYLEPGAEIPYKLAIPSKALSVDSVFQKIRNEGGAYGAGFKLRLGSGVMKFSSYRDPHIGETFDNFMASAREDMASIAKEIDQEGIDQQIVRAISNIDAPMSNTAHLSQAFAEYFKNETDESQQRLRDGLFDTRPADFFKLAEILDRVWGDEKQSAKGKVAVSLGTRKNLELEKMPKWMVRNDTLQIVEVASLRGATL